MAQTQIKEIEGYNGYFIDTDGNVWTTKKFKGRDGLTKLTLSKKKKQVTYTLTFIGEKRQMKEVH